MCNILKKIILFTILALFISFCDAVEVEFFYSKYCEHCEEIINNFLPPILKKYEGKVNLTKYEIEDNLDNYELLLKREAQAGDSDNEIPVIFIGNEVLGGDEEIKKNFVKLLKKELKKEELTSHIASEEKPEDKPETHPLEKGTIGVEIPETTVVAKQETTRSRKDTVYIIFFSEKGCAHCDRVQHDLRLLSERPPSDINAVIVYKKYDIAEPESKLLHEAFCERNNVQEEYRLATPAVFIKDAGFIYGYQGIGNNFYFPLVKKIKELGDKCKNVVLWEDITPDELVSAERRITARFSRFNVAPIVVAGLLDGINPCAFGALVFFITFLTIAERKKNEILLVGLAYTIAVFITYYAVGAGFLGFLASLPIFEIIARWVYILTGVLAVGLGILSIIDFVKAKQGKLSEMTLQLPDKLKKKIHRVIIAENEPRKTKRNFLVAAFITGFFVSLLELACTGQVYLPTIIYVLGIPGLRMKAHLYLLLYNFMFIIPLLVVFVISYMGTTSEQLNGFLKKNTALIKFLTALMFFGMAVLLWRSILIG
ncbi:hypothetical protein DRQ33_02250 [bacterium]|nr:MAG: hypothetical protein DRQ33_02250 [bacterium]